MQADRLPIGRDHVDDDAVRVWLRDVMRTTGLKPTPLAKAAGLAASTILRALDPTNPGSLERRSIEKIMRTFGVAPPPLYVERGATAQGGTGLAEPELVESREIDESDPDLAPTQKEWTIKTRALELVGYLPGDLVRADSAATPKTRDVVVAQIIEHDRGAPKNVLRVYDPPYLLTETLDPHARRKPLLVDHDTAEIWGVVVRSVRQRKDD